MSKQACNKSYNRVWPAGKSHVALPEIYEKLIFCHLFICYTWRQFKVKEMVTQVDEKQGGIPIIIICHDLNSQNAYYENKALSFFPPLCRLLVGNCIKKMTSEIICTQRLILIQYILNSNWNIYVNISDVIFRYNYQKTIRILLMDLWCNFFFIAESM